MKIKIIIFGLFLNLASLYSQVEPPFENDTYEISTLEHLRWVSETPNSWKSNFKLMNDIDAADTKNWDEGRGWKPIGRHYGKKIIWFRGNFDGQGFKISNLFLNRADKFDSLTGYCGFFGITEKFGHDSDVILQKINNLGLENVNITGCHTMSETGGLVGCSYYSEIRNCYVTGKVQNGMNCGLLVGNCNFSSVEHCYAIGSVAANICCGGLIGRYESVFKYPINECFVIADIKCQSETGGFCYRLWGKITNCFSICNIDVDYLASGFVSKGVESSQIINSYSASQIKYKTDSGIFVFSQAMKSDPYKNINCFCDNEICKDTAGRQVIPKNTAEMKTKETFTSATWDFDTVWAISPDLNNGYPYLQFAEKFFTPVKEEIISNSDFSVLPNPAGDYINISNVNYGEHIEIYNLLGTKQFETIYKGQINISNLPVGVYYLKVGNQTKMFIRSN